MVKFDRKQGEAHPAGIPDAKYRANREETPCGYP